jgi:glycerophosphoryl diester phosphodiesterase
MLRSLFMRKSFPLLQRLGPWVMGSALLCAATCVGAEPFDLQGHRGARGLAPENTLAAFARALAIGVTTLETDVAVTRDGVLVIAHDPFLNPDLVRDAQGRWLTGKGPAIRTLTLAQLLTYELGRINPGSKYAAQFPEQVPVDGQRWPTLAQVFALARPSPVRFNIETKITPDSGDDTVDPVTFARLVIAAIRGAGMADRTTVQSFDWRTLVAIKKQDVDIETACLTIESSGMDTVGRQSSGPSPWHAGIGLRQFNGSMPRMVQAARCSTWSMFWRNLTPGEVTEAHALGLKVLPWTVNDPADMARLIDMKVDGIITDYPDRLRRVMAARGMPLPPAFP